MQIVEGNKKEHIYKRIWQSLTVTLNFISWNWAADKCKKPAALHHTPHDLDVNLP